MTPAIYSFVWTPKFVFWLAVVVAMLSSGAIILGVNTLTHKPHQESGSGFIFVPADTVLNKQVHDIFTIVHRIDSLSQMNTGRIDRLEQNK